MIVLDLKGEMHCSEPGCKRREPVEFCLMATGGFGFKPSVTNWQILVDPKNPIYQAACPEHIKRVQPVKMQVGPAGPRIVTEH